MFVWRNLNIVCASHGSISFRNLRIVIHNTCIYIYIYIYIYIEREREREKRERERGKRFLYYTYLCFIDTRESTCEDAISPVHRDHRPREASSRRWSPDCWGRERACRRSAARCRGPAGGTASPVCVTPGRCYAASMYHLMKENNYKQLSPKSAKLTYSWCKTDSIVATSLVQNGTRLLQFSQHQFIVNWNQRTSNPWISTWTNSLENTNKRT